MFDCGHINIEDDGIIKFGLVFAIGSDSFRINGSVAPEIGGGSNQRGNFSASVLKPNGEGSRRQVNKFVASVLIVNSFRRIARPNTNAFVGLDRNYLLGRISVVVVFLIIGSLCRITTDLKLHKRYLNT